MASTPANESGGTTPDGHPPDGPALTPRQQATLDALGATADRPTFPAGLGAELADALNAGITAAFPGGPPNRADDPMFVSKRDLHHVHTCEGLAVAERAAPFAWAVPVAVGTVAHRAIELGIHWDGDPPPRVLVDAAITSAAESAGSLGDWLYGLDDGERAALCSAAVERVTAFTEVFPALKPAWRPVCEARHRLEVTGGAVVLSGKTDLSLGQGRGTEAGKVIIDFKTGAQRVHHTDDLRFYALLETITRGVPPRLVATAYLDSGVVRTEQVTTDVLAAALARTVGGVTALVELATRAPALRASGACRWCPALDACPVGSAHLAGDDGRDYDPDGD